MKKFAKANFNHPLIAPGSLLMAFTQEKSCEAQITSQLF